MPVPAAGHETGVPDSLMIVCVLVTVSAVLSVLPTVVVTVIVETDPLSLSSLESLRILLSAKAPGASWYPIAELLSQRSLGSPPPPHMNCS